MSSASLSIEVVPKAGQDESADLITGISGGALAEMRQPQFAALLKF